MTISYAKLIFAENEAQMKKQSEVSEPFFLLGKKSTSLGKRI